MVVITVQRGTAHPYYIASKGISPEGVYVHQGASTVPETESAILNMIKETNGDSYESARSLATAILLLKKMVGEGTLNRTGDGKEVRYAFS